MLPRSRFPYDRFTRALAPMPGATSWDPIDYGQAIQRTVPAPATPLPAPPREPPPSPCRFCWHRPRCRRGGLFDPAGSDPLTPPAGRVTPQHTYVFGEPAYWPATLHWRYNPAGAPAAFSANKAATIQQIVDASAKWTAACGVQIVYDGETTAAPATLDRASVIGWQVPQGGYMAATSDWTDIDGSGDTLIVDSDIALEPDDGDDRAAAGVNHHPRMGTRDRAGALAIGGYLDGRTTGLGVLEPRGSYAG